MSEKTIKEVKDTRSAFINYCVGLFNEKVKPMLVKLKRVEAPKAGGKKIEDLLKASKWNPLQAGITQAQLKLKLRQDRLRMNLFYAEQERAEDPNLLIMEEIKYYEHLDQDIEEAKKREQEEEEARVKAEHVRKVAERKKHLDESAPLRYKYKLKFVPKKKEKVIHLGKALLEREAARKR